MPEAIIFSAIILAIAIWVSAHKVGVSIMYLAFILSRMGVRVKEES